MKTLLSVSAIVEAGAGIALLTAPSVTASFLLGAALETSVAGDIARIGGAAILVMACACWLTRDMNKSGSRQVVTAMLLYNFVVAAVLVFAGVGHELYGPLLWPAIGFHVAMFAWCVLTQVSKQNLLLP